MKNVYLWYVVDFLADLAEKFCQELATWNLSATQLQQFSTLSEMQAQTSTPN
jgi:hypothetical protein